MEFRTEQGRSRYDALVAVARDVVVGVDFDGTLSPIVADPSQAVIHPDAPETLAALALAVRAVVVITGRPARQVVELGHLEQVADRLAGQQNPSGGRAHLVVHGQYGNERWDSATREFTSPEPPEGLESFRRALPDLLAAQDAAEAHVEEKGLAIAVHTRRLPDAQAAFDRLRTALGDAAEQHGLSLEPGRMVLEVRAPGMHKGVAVRTAVEEHEAGGIMFAGDDLGDLEAFEAVRELREGGLAALLVCSSSDEQEALAEQADVVVAGPDGVMELLGRFTAAARTS